MIDKKFIKIFKDKDIVYNYNEFKGRYTINLSFNKEDELFMFKDYLEMFCKGFKFEHSDVNRWPVKDSRTYLYFLEDNFNSFIDQIEEITFFIKSEQYDLFMKKSEGKKEKSIIKQKKNERLILANKVKNLLLNKEINEATEELVRYLENKKTFRSIVSNNKPERWFYNEGIYEPYADSYVKEELRLILEEGFKESYANQVLSKIDADNFINQDDFFNSQIKHPFIIPVINGLLDIRNSHLDAFSDNIYFFNKLPMRYNPEADCPNIKRFLREILENEDSFLIIQELFGYVLVKNYFLSKAIMFEGKTASNGKSVLCSLLKKFVNEENVSSENIANIDNEPFALCNLQNKMINFCMEISQSALDNKGVFKQITGGDLVSANRKGLSYIKFHNYAKLIFTANELPYPKNADEGFWRRWIRIKFPNRFLSQKEIDAIPEDERNNIFLKDDKLLEKITTDKELEGLLNFALEGLKRLLNNGDFSSKKTINEEKMEWLRTTNTFLAYIQDNIEDDYDSYITKEDLRNAYHEYCKENQLKTVNDNVIKVTLDKEFGSYDTRIRDKSNFNNDRIYVWKNIKFKNPIIRENKINEEINMTDLDLSNFVYSNPVDNVQALMSTFGEQKINSYLQSGDLMMVNPTTLQLRK